MYGNYYITVTMVIYLLWKCIYGLEWAEDEREHLCRSRVPGAKSIKCLSNQRYSKIVVVQSYCIWAGHSVMLRNNGNYMNAIFRYFNGLLKLKCDFIF